MTKRTNEVSEVIREKGGKCKSHDQFLQFKSYGMQIGGRGVK